jgi:hypothetical protein
MLELRTYYYGLYIFSLGLMHTVQTTLLEVYPSCSASTALATVITAIATALLATIIFVLVQIAVCKCHPKFGAETGTSAGGEGQEYEQMEGGVAETGERVYELVDGGRDGVKATIDPTYMEVGGGGNTFQLKGNEAYASTTVATAHT